MNTKKVLVTFFYAKSFREDVGTKETEVASADRVFN